MTAALERELAELVKLIRDREIAPLRQRLEQVERRLDFEERLARLEQRAGIERTIDLPSFDLQAWRGNGGNAA
jgi:ribosomal 50S subunit-associated protein YjgA (DUF615 family)